VYNPAGTVFLLPGLTLGLSNQSVFKVYENDLAIPGATIPSNYNQDFKSTVPTYFLPNGEAIWNGGKWAVYLASGVVAGGGTAQYDNGVPTMPLDSTSVKNAAIAKYGAAVNGAVWTGGNLTASSLYPQVTLGGAYAVTETLSISAAARYVYATDTFTGQASYNLLNGASVVAPTTLYLDVTKVAQGFGGIFGVDWKAFPGFLVTGRFETATPLAFKTTVNNGKDFGGTFVDGTTQNRDLPALAAVGLRYDWDAFSVTVSGTGYLLGPSLSDGYNNATNSQDAYDSFGWETGGSVEYAIIPGFLKASVGGLYDKVGGNAATYNDFDFSLDSESVGGGVVVTPLKDLDCTLAVSKTFYNSATGNQTGTQYTTYKKDAFTVDIGAQYKLF